MKINKNFIKSENFFRSGGFEKIPGSKKEDGEKNDLTLEVFMTCIICKRLKFVEIFFNFSKLHCWRGYHWRGK